MVFWEIKIKNFQFCCPFLSLNACAFDFACTLGAECSCVVFIDFLCLFSLQMGWAYTSGSPEGSLPNTVKYK
jgi:hypothetical protein